MDVQTTAAIYGGVAGAIISGVFGVATLFVGRQLRRRGGVRFTPPSDWRFAYFEWEGQGQQVTPGRAVLTQSIYYRRDVAMGESHRANCFAYAFTANLLNRMDVGAALNDVHVAFMKDGAQMFRHRPFDEESAEDLSGFLFEEGYRDVVADLGEKAKPPGQGIEPIGPVALPSHIPVQKKLRGYIGPHSGSVAELHHLKGGCDEVRLQATREDETLFDERIARIQTGSS